jgi:general secretion pathway protein F
MGAFEFSAIDAGGRVRKGVLEGDTPRQVRQRLREKGLVPLTVDGVAGGGGRGGAFRLQGGGLKPADLALVTRQLATLVRAGTVLEEALGAVAEQAEKGRVKSLLMAVRAKVLEGHSIDRALADFPVDFPELYRATMSAGEQAGHLDVVLERLADYTEFRQQLRQRILLALLYPVLLTTVAVLVIGALLAYVVPQVVEVFIHLGQELPLLTRALIGVSGFLRDYGLLLVAGTIGLALAGRALSRKKRVRRRLHRLLLRLPLLGRFSRSLNAARFARSLSILVASGVPLLEGLSLSSKVLGNLAMREALERAAAKVREGGSLHLALAAEGCFPPLTIHLIASGEASSALEQMLERAATTQEREVETLISAAMGLFEPALILLMGGIVLLIVLAILLPIFELNQLVR